MYSGYKQFWLEETMKKLMAVLVGLSLIGAGCSGNGTESQDGSSQGAGDTQVANCPDCGEAMVEGKCAA